MTLLAHKQQENTMNYNSISSDEKKNPEAEVNKVQDDLERCTTKSLLKSAQNMQNLGVLAFVTIVYVIGYMWMSRSGEIADPTAVVTSSLNSHHGVLMDLLSASDDVIAPQTSSLTGVTSKVFNSVQATFYPLFDDHAIQQTRQMTPETFAMPSVDQLETIREIFYEKIEMEIDEGRMSGIPAGELNLYRKARLAHIDSVFDLLIKVSKPCAARKYDGPTDAEIAKVQKLGEAFLKCLMGIGARLLVRTGVVATEAEGMEQIEEHPAMQARFAEIKKANRLIVETLKLVQKLCKGKKKTVSGGNNAGGNTSNSNSGDANSSSESETTEAAPGTSGEMAFFGSS